VLFYETQPKRDLFQNNHYVQILILLNLSIDKRKILKAYLENLETNMIKKKNSIAIDIKIRNNKII